jgi:hypothetical protein
LQSLPVKSKAKRSPVLLILLFALISLLSVLAIAQVRRSRSSHAVAPPQPPRSAAAEPKAEPTPADQVPSPSAAAEELPDSPQEVAPKIDGDTPSLKRAGFSSSPVAAASAATPPTAVVHLKNGAAIKADEVWETREGYWYRQAGMVTFLKRSQVSTVERPPTSRAPQKLAAGNGEERSRKSDDRIAQNQPRIRRLEPVEKKPSRVKSFLQLTGRILKKPFR